MRILMFTGKGGVGKTSLAAATGVKQHDRQRSGHGWHFVQMLTGDPNDLFGRIKLMAEREEFVPGWARGRSSR